MPLKTLLVDDEPLALERLRDLLMEADDVEIAGTAANGLEALEALRELRPDLVFLDIQMPELDGFEVIQALGPEAMPMVVFATAYDRFAIRAFEKRALDYLLKPFSAERLRDTLQRARETRAARTDQDRLQGLLKDLEPRRRERFVVRKGDRFVVLPVQEVEAIEAESNYMWLYRGGEAYSLRATLAALEDGLDPARFLRAHRSWMLNLQRVRELLPGPKGGLVAVTAGGLKVPVSQAHRKSLEARLG